jgi:sulfur-oxidizing protein SoxB
MRLDDKLIDADGTYKVAGWAPVSEEAKQAGGEPIWDLMSRYLKDIKTVRASPLNMPTIKGTSNNPGLA